MSTALYEVAPRVRLGERYTDAVLDWCQDHGVGSLWEAKDRTEDLADFMGGRG